MSDFLKRAAQTPLQGFYLAAGARCLLATNFEPILAAARRGLLEIDEPSSAVDFNLRFWVDSDGQSQPPWPKPYFRGLDHLVFAGFNSENSMLIDLRTRRAIGRFSPALAADQAYWETVIFPTLLSVMGATAGVTGLHCGCVVRNGGGLLLCGRSGSGKSTLTLALARKGFSFLSDDWTYFSRSDGQLHAWGLATRLKLLPDAPQFFPELDGFEVGVSLNGEPAYEVDPVLQLGIARTRCCDPRWLIFLERQSAPAFHLTRAPAMEASTRLEEDLLAETAELPSPQLSIIESLAGRECWLLQYGGDPETAAQSLADLCRGA
ncbi:MAG: HPr kinase/phosphorylase [Terriglobia bacterium]